MGATLQNPARRDAFKEVPFVFVRRKFRTMMEQYVFSTQHVDGHANVEIQIVVQSDKQVSWIHCDLADVIKHPRLIVA
jgi:hypothetical protein